jgi:23S rRNA (adenine2503-C2)-methyltransferase
MTKISFCDVTLDELAQAGPPGSAKHLLGRLHRVGKWVQDASTGERRPELGKEVRAFVEERFDFRLPRIVAKNPSDDGSTKLLLALEDGATVETVHMPRAVKNPRVTLCISSQVGCAMGCTFCRTAEMGLVRSLRPHEIVGQVLATLLELGPEDPGRVSLVFMGMGEPLHVGAIDHVTRAIEILCEEYGLGLAPMRITVSTSGLVPGIEALARAKRRPCLALSLNATTDEARARIMPVTKRHGLSELRAALLAYPVRPHEKITLEYVLLAGVNDTAEDADRIADFARGYRSVVNVIPWNAYPTGDFVRPEDDAASAFVTQLHERGCLVTVRRSRGRDVGGACGQLATDATRQKAPRRLAVLSG